MEVFPTDKLLIMEVFKLPDFSRIEGLVTEAVTWLAILEITLGNKTDGLSIKVVPFKIATEGLDIIPENNDA